MTLVTAVRVLPALAAVLALAVAHRRPSYRPVAAFLTVVSLATAARAALRLAAPALALARVPAHVPRLALRADQALYLVWPAALVVLGLAVCLARRARPALLAWAVASALFAVGAVRGALAVELYALIEVAALSFVGGTLVAWSGRDKIPGPAQIATVLVLVFAGLAFASTRANAATLWPSALACYAVLYASLIVLSGVAWICSPPRS